MEYRELPHGIESVYLTCYFEGYELLWLVEALLAEGSRAGLAAILDSCEVGIFESEC